ncbi:MAG: hypothetical protein RL562_1529 [Planctomycetota bacterium]
MTAKRRRRKPPKLDDDLEEELAQFRDDPNCPICIAHSYDCEGMGGDFDQIFRWKDWYVACVMQNEPTFHETLEDAVLESGVGFIGCYAFEHDISSELETEDLRRLLERANAPDHNGTEVPVPFNLDGIPHILLPGGHIVPGEFTLLPPGPPIAGDRRNRIVESVTRLPNLNYLFRRTTGTLGETPESSTELELEQIGTWLLKDGRKAPARLRTRLAGLHAYAESMQDASLLRELDWVNARLDSQA